MLDDIKREILLFSDEKRAKANLWFFKTKKGQYGYGDKFLGLTVPDQRKVAKKFAKLTMPDLESLLESPIHEERLVSLFILTDKFIKGNEKLQKEIFEFYLKSTKHINNWDLVDASAYKIIGAYVLKNHKEQLLKKLAKSKSIWERRMAIIATYHFIINGESRSTYEIANLLLNDRHDLIQKAVGWMLREAGKRVSEAELKEFLKTRYKRMPRTMLRYSIEKFDEKTRKAYLQNKI